MKSDESQTCVQLCSYIFYRDSLELVCMLQYGYLLHGLWNELNPSKASAGENTWKYMLHPYID